MRHLASAAVRLLLVALIAACCAPFGSAFGPHDAGVAPVLPTSLPAAPPLAGAGCPGTYHLELGPAVSPTSPYLVEHLHEGEQMPTGYVAADLTRRDTEFFTPCRIRVGLYSWHGATRRLELEDPRDLHGDESSFMKSWHIPGDGDFEVVVTDDATSSVLAHARFPVRATPVPAVHAGITCTGSYDSVIGPAESPTSPYLAERLHHGDVLHAPVYVALELTPHGTGHFPACRMRFGLYMHAEDGKRLIVESEREMSTSEGVFDKSWVIRDPGEFEIAVSDVNGGGTRIATQRFTVSQ